jgi:hypothetical protein
MTTCVDRSGSPAQTGRLSSSIRISDSCKYNRKNGPITHFSFFFLSRYLSAFLQFHYSRYNGYLNIIHKDISISQSFAGDIFSKNKKGGTFEFLKRFYFFSFCYPPTQPCSCVAFILFYSTVVFLFFFFFSDVSDMKKNKKSFEPKGISYSSQMPTSISVSRHQTLYLKGL